MNEQVKIKKHYPSYKAANKNKKKKKTAGLTKRKTGYFYPRKRKQHNVKYLCQRIINIDKE